MSQLAKVALVLVAVVAGVHAAGTRDAFSDPIGMPAALSRQPSALPLMSVARVGESLVAVGPRGAIVRAETAGGPIEQIASPVGTDLVAVHFPTANLGWAVGHDGIVLHSADGGRSWVKQLDGFAAAAGMLRHYEETYTGDPDGEALLGEVRRMVEMQPLMSFMDVWFRNEREGWIVGAYNLIFHTVDGGVHWTPLYHLTDNPDRLHLYGVRGSGDELFIAGERGLVLRRDAASGRFTALETPYDGSWFGLFVDARDVLLFGLQGNAWRSTDGGGNWSRIAIDTTSELTAGAVFGDGGRVLVSQRGEVHLSTDGGASFSAVVQARKLPFHGVADAGDGRLALVGARGFAVQASGAGR